MKFLFVGGDKHGEWINVGQPERRTYQVAVPAPRPSTNEFKDVYQIETYEAIRFRMEDDGVIHTVFVLDGYTPAVGEIGTLLRVGRKRAGSEAFLEALERVTSKQGREVRIKNVGTHTRLLLVDDSDSLFHSQRYLPEKNLVTYEGGRYALLAQNLELMDTELSALQLKNVGK